jgi:hypothetical protein
MGSVITSYAIKLYNLGNLFHGCFAYHVSKCHYIVALCMHVWHSFAKKNCKVRNKWHM